jgi:hypothetical protein
MKVSRRGASADFGESSIEFKTPGFSWNPANSCITIKQSRVRDFSTDSRHNYTVSLSLAEVQGLLLAISDAAVADPTAFEKGLEPSLKPLLRLQAVVAGTVG